jgi:hypothetical protein
MNKRDAVVSSQRRPVRRPAGLKFTEIEASEAGEMQKQLDNASIGREIKRYLLRLESKHQRIVKNNILSGQTWSCTFCQNIVNGTLSSWQKHITTADHHTQEVAFYLGIQCLYYCCNGNLVKIDCNCYNIQVMMMQKYSMCCMSANQFRQSFIPLHPLHCHIRTL